MIRSYRQFLRIEALRAPSVRRQDRGREADAFRIVGPGLTVANARLAHRDGADAGHDLALGQMTVAHNALAAFFGLQIAMLGKKVRHLCLNGLDE